MDKITARNNVANAGLSARAIAHSIYLATVQGVSGANQNDGMGFALSAIAELWNIKGDIGNPNGKTKLTGRYKGMGITENMIFTVIAQHPHGFAKNQPLFDDLLGIGFKKSPKMMTLAEFRDNAPYMTGYRDELLAYRKSLLNTWDYNAYVGILLGVGGSKHGDSACMNFGIGQGDNGNNVKRTLMQKGLMPKFEKYKGKKPDNKFVLLEEVEGEILWIAPEYAAIQRKLHQTILR